MWFMHKMSLTCGTYGPERVKYIDFLSLIITVEQEPLQLATDPIVFKSFVTKFG
jgi:hypothetical protein